MSAYCLLAAVVTVVLTAAAPYGQIATGTQTEIVIVKEASGQGEKHFHRPGCPLVRDGKEIVAMTRAEAESREFKAHRDCDPAQSAATAQPQAAATAQPQAPAAKAPPTTVFVDAGTTYYHRKNCPKLGKPAKSVALTAVSKRWPCPTCRPPVPKRATEPVVPRWRGTVSRG